MIGYVTVGTNDIDKAAAFYDALLAEFGAKRAMEMGRVISWASAPGTPMLAVIKPFNGEPASAGNGTMVALAAPSREAVDRIYAKAMSLGATDEGGPGLRGGEGSTFYAAYIRDLDGNKLNIFNRAASSQ